MKELFIKKVQTKLNMNAEGKMQTNLYEQMFDKGGKIY